jgi:hypothetical protein
MASPVHTIALRLKSTSAPHPVSTRQSDRASRLVSCNVGNSDPASAASAAHHAAQTSRIELTLGAVGFAKNTKLRTTALPNCAALKASCA